MAVLYICGFSGDLPVIPCSDENIGHFERRNAYPFKFTCKVKELTEENTRLRSQVPSMKKRMEEAQRQQRLEQENRRLREENSYLQYELEEERSFSERLTDGIGRLLDYLEERLPERLLPLLEKARELLPNPEIGRQQEQQQHQRGMGGMEL